MKNESLPGGKRRWIEDYFDSSLFFRVLLILLVFITCLFVTAPRQKDELQKLVLGQLSPFSLCADFDFMVEDKVKSDSAREQVAGSVPDYYQIQEDRTAEILQRNERFFQEVKKRESAERAGQTYNPGREGPGQWAKELSGGAMNFFLRLVDNPPRLQKYGSLLDKFLKDGIMGESDYEDLLNTARQIKVVDEMHRRTEVAVSAVLNPDRCARQMVAQLLDSTGSADENKVVESAEKALCRILEGGNLQYDKIFTENKRKEAADKLPVIYRKIFGGTMILTKGKTVKDEDLAIYKAYSEEKAKRKNDSVLPVILRENVLPCIALLLVLGVYLFFMQKNLVKHNRSLCLLGIILILGILLNRYLYNGLLLLAENTHFPHQMIYLALPLGFSGCLISVIFGIRTALICGLFTSVVAALCSPTPFSLMLFGFMISSGGSLAVRYNTLNYRSFFLKSFIGTVLGAVLMAMIFFLREQQEFSIEDLWICAQMLGVILCMGLITAMLTQMVLILLELFFDLNTTMSLLICCDYNHPLLKEMQLKAPGTYHHCLMVASLAERAAQDSGLDPVKARACGLYHDIGKIVQPEFFIENCRLGVDMHKNMDPAMSAMIIRSHVVDHGMELARKYKLKKILRDAISQHHGNDLIVYFHKKAQEQAQGRHVSENDFRYPCQLPVDKEICVVMLSDCCEAASRSLERPTPEALEELISEIFRKKIRSGQLDASHLTMNELARIRKSFVNTLQHMYHGRIAYPKDEKQDENDLFMESGKTVQET